MSLKEELEKILAEDRKRLEELKKMLDSLVFEKTELEKTIESAETLLSRKFGLRFNEINKDENRGSIETKFTYKSTQDAAFEIISERSNKPLHIKDIYRYLTEGGKKLKNQSSVGVSLRRDSRFKLIGPNVFAIDVDWLKKEKGLTLNQ